MFSRVTGFVVVIALVAGVARGGTAGRIKGAYEAPQVDGTLPVSTWAKVLPDPDWSAMRPAVGTFTTLSGFYDYQSNGGSLQYVRVNPLNGNIHVTYMLADDSTAAGLNPARRVGYAFSSDGGATWNNFNNMRIPDRRSGYPSIDLGKGAISGGAVIANHSIITAAGQQGTIFVDFPEGGGAFGEIPPPIGFGSDEAEWPFVAAASDGSVIMAASRNTAATVHYARTDDFIAWSPLAHLVQATQGGGRTPIQANGTGRVGMVANTSNGTTALGNWWIESTNNGQSWSSPVNLFPFRVAGVDTFNAYVHSDMVYNGNTPLFLFSEYARDANRNDADIVFWSQPTGFQVAVPYDTAKYTFDPLNQRFHGLDLGWGSIGMSGSTIVVAFQAFQPDTDSRGYHYSDVWFTKSNDGGLTWSPSENLTNTPAVDERYPSVSKWNAPGQANIVWSQKSKSGLYAFPGTADTVRTFQVFYKKIISDVKSENRVAASFALAQNFPNPFNPATKIDYTVTHAGPVTIKVYDALGREVTTLLNAELRPGSYHTTFDGTNLASGVYVYRMTAGGHSESKKMMLMK